MSMEIAIHRSVGQKKSPHLETHKQIVGFHGFFEDSDYIYILLELCRRRVGRKNNKKSLLLHVDDLRKTVSIFRRQKYIFFCF